LHVARITPFPYPKLGNFHRTPMANSISTQALRKEFGDKTAVADLSLDVERGEVFGFLGPNGAGKTTAVKMLLGLISPTSGNGEVLGAPLGDYRSREKVGFLPEHFRFHDWLTAEEFLRLHGNLYKIPSPILSTRIAELLELVGLENHREKKLRAFSKGMLQRIGLAQALLNEPDLVFLDEPTSGLDPVGRRLVRDIIRDLREGGTTVFLNSHMLSEVEITCDRVAFIRQGEVLTTNSLQSLVEGELTVEIRAQNVNPAVLEGLARWGENIRADGDHLSLTLSSEADMPVLTRYLVENGVDVYAIRPKQLSLEDLFIQVVGTEGGL
jgi:ABC-2 type transport system ATP-binding protein